MKIVIIRHAEVDMKWERRYNSAEFNEACRKYDISPIKTIDKKCKLINKYKEGYKVYISELPRTEATAKELFGNKNFCKSALLNEVAIKSFMDTERKLPTLLWNTVGRVQWILNDKDQIEPLSETIYRARKAISMLERANEDCCIVTHGCFMRVFLWELRRSGYKINKVRIAIKNLEEFIANKYVINEKECFK